MFTLAALIKAFAPSTQPHHKPHIKDNGAVTAGEACGAGAREVTAPTMVWEPIAGRESAWTARHLLTDDECAELIRLAEANNIHTASNSGNVNNLRSCLRVTIDLPELAATIWSRIRDAVPQKVTIAQGTPSPPGVPNNVDVQGVWRAVGVNHRFRIVLYPGTGYFGPHRDGDYVANPDLRSLITINGYMNAVPSGMGGATRFLTENQPLYRDETGKFTPQPGSITHSISPEPGMAVCFFHGLMHDGEPLKDGAPQKWLFRTEVMYARDEGTGAEFSENEVLARQLLKQAEDTEAVNAMAAMKLYRRAYKLDPKLEEATRES
eukprot:m.13253 g.13253  ORF g.13253 m.13253 type:complete len:322 (-) comp4632_c0_seq1:263-1228(-)